MRWRLTEDLGYRRTHALELMNTRGGTIYHMVFATDNDAGDKIMADIYAKAARRSPRCAKKLATASSAKPRWTSESPTRRRVRRTTTSPRGSLLHCPDRRHGGFVVLCMPPVDCLNLGFAKPKTKQNGEGGIRTRDGV